MFSQNGPQVVLNFCKVFGTMVLFFSKKKSYTAGKFIGETEKSASKGQIISKRFFLAEDSSKKRTKTRRILVKTNSFVRFLEESLA